MAALSGYGTGRNNSTGKARPERCACANKKTRKPCGSGQAFHPRMKEETRFNAWKRLVSASAIRHFITNNGNNSCVSAASILPLLLDKVALQFALKLPAQGQSPQLVLGLQPVLRTWLLC
jgi:hypothetical protein